MKKTKGTEKNKAEGGRTRVRVQCPLCHEAVEIDEAEMPTECKGVGRCDDCAVMREVVGKVATEELDIGKCGRCGSVFAGDELSTRVVGLCPCCAETAMEEMFKGMAERMFAREMAEAEKTASGKG